MQPVGDSWYKLFGDLMKTKGMTLDDAVKWCKEFTDIKLAYEKYREG